MALTKATYSMISGAPINVKDYGAVGDGTTDDTAAIQAALANNKEVYIPNGTYKTTATLTINIRGQKIIGESSDDTVIMKSFDGVGMTTSVDNVNISCLRIDSSGDDAGNTSAHGLVLDGKRWNVSELILFGHAGRGFYASKGNLSLAQKINVAGNNIGIWLDGVDTNALTLIDLDSRSNAAQGIVLNGVYGVTIIGGYSANNGSWGWQLECTRTVALGIGGEQNTLDTLLLGGDSIKNYIVMTKGTCVSEQPAEQPIKFNTIINTDNSTASHPTLFAGGYTNHNVGADSSGFYNGGVIFPVNNIASSNGNDLDDYQEGTWTPTIIRTTTSGTYTPDASDYGDFTKIGNTVTVRGKIAGTYSGGSGNYRISALPIPNKNAFSTCAVFNATAGTSEIVRNANSTGTGLASQSLSNFTYVSGNVYYFSITYFGQF